MTSTTFSSRSTVESVWGRIRSRHWQWSGWGVSSCLVGLAGHWPRCPLPSWRVPVLLHLLLLLGNPRLPLLLLQGAVGTRATPLPELAEPSFPPKQPSGQHLNIGKIFGTSPGSTDLQEKFIQKVTFSPQKNVILSTKFSIYILLHAGYTQNLYKC